MHIGNMEEGLDILFENLDEMRFQMNGIQDGSGNGI